MNTGFVQRSVITLAAATGSDGGRGKVGTIPASGVLYVRCECDRNMQKLDWVVKADKAFTVQLYRAETLAESVTVTLSSLANDETGIINGLTYTAKDAGSTVASRYYNSGGADATADAAALAAVLNASASGTIGLTATSALGVVTLVPSTLGGAFVIQAVTGTAAGHFAVASTTLTGLVKHGSSTADATAAGNSTTGGTYFEQWTDGAPYCYLGITNNAASDALTPVIKAIRYW